ncbi:UNVERIFIED_CONTAM: hypothetical protein Sradi_1726200 [Sesamum radiatum]|uniref:Uncharacterized protein n=1 Tax=Sesamum radiatum TaxID=300843 RepID=A0AAW2TTQ8_SESRA
MMTARGAWAVCNPPHTPTPWVTALLRAVTLGMRSNFSHFLLFMRLFLSFFLFFILSNQNSSHQGRTWAMIPLKPCQRGQGEPSYVAGRRWSLRQTARRLLDEPFEEEGDGEEDEGSSSGEMDTLSRKERILSGNRGSCPVGSGWVACCIT